jgi:SAM-dependent methyltransferase
VLMGWDGGKASLGFVRSGQVLSPERPMPQNAVLPDPGAGMDLEKMPLHWLLARLGKTVMRPGGGAVSDAMLTGLRIGPDDDVVDLAPGLGTTVQRVQALRPASFRGLERGEAEAERSRRQVTELPYTCVVAEPEKTGLPDASVSVVYGEACLSLEGDATKERILAEAARVLRPGGRLGLHELLLNPDDLDPGKKKQINVDLSRAVRVNARALTRSEWTTMLERHGFTVTAIHADRMLLLSPAQMVHDEGLGGTLRLVGRIARRPVAVKRVAHLWRMMHRERKHLGAVAIVATLAG